MTNIPTIRPRKNLKSRYYMDTLAIAGFRSEQHNFILLTLIGTDIEGGGEAVGWRGV